ncbi:MAG: sigma 54-interacting transcriptional regulator [Thermodesulfobacteriota bacterium]
MRKEEICILEEGGKVKKIPLPFLPRVLQLPIEKLEKDKEKMLSVVAFGCNKKAQEELADLFEDKLANKIHFFYEYFLTYPITQSPSSSNKIRCSAPFLERILRRSNFIPKKIEKFTENYRDIEWLPKSDDNLNEFLKDGVGLEYPEDSAILGKHLYLMWKDEKHEVPEVSNERIKDYCIKSYPYDFEDKKKKQPKMRYLAGWLTIDYLDRTYLPGIRKTNVIVPEEDQIALLKEFTIVVYPWLRNPPQSRINFIAVPIASREIFYGYLLLFYAGETKHEQQKEEESKIKDYLRNSLFGLSQNLYLPVLALFENSWAEEKVEEYLESIQSALKDLKWDADKKLSEEVKKQLLREDGTMTIKLPLKKENSSKVNRFYELNCVYLNPSLVDRSSIEGNLAWLWEERRKLIKNQGELSDSLIEKYLDSLILAKYLMASPGMIKEIENIMSFNLRKLRDSLPSALIIGGPGSGKEKMAKLIQLFSEGYTFEEVYAFNMALLKPKELVPALMMGTSTIFNRGEGEKEEYSLLGIFQKLSQPKARKGKENEYMQTIILDELNSLDIESQGALLRLLENSEITPLGGLDKSVDKKQIKFLIIGLMNEDPEKLTRQAIIEEILRNNKGLFGGLIGDIMYEYFRKLRRLRDDLYDRIKRGGKIVILDLRERREDIPILFYFFIRDEWKLSSFDEFHIDFDAFDLLMDERFKWSGNIRQLQTIAKKAFNKARIESNSTKLSIKRKHVESVLKYERLIDERLLTFKI